MLVISSVIYIDFSQIKCDILKVRKYFLQFDSVAFVSSIHVPGPLTRNVVKVSVRRLPRAQAWAPAEGCMLEFRHRFT